MDTCRLQEFNPVDGYFCLVYADGKLIAKTWDKADADKIIIALEQLNAFLPEARAVALEETKELKKTNAYFAGIIKCAAEEYLSANGCLPEWWTIPLMHEIKEILGIETPAATTREGK